MATVGLLVEGKRDVISVECTVKVREVLDFMHRERLTAVAVFGQPHHWVGAGSVELISQGKQYIGIVSVVDILNFIFSSEDCMHQLNSPIVNALGSSIESLSLWVEPTSRPMEFLMEEFCKGTHYALVVEEHHPEVPVRMVAQADVVRYLFSHRQLYPIFQHRVSEFATTDVRSLHEHASMISALPLLLQFRAVPIVNVEGHLVGSLSVSDLKGINSADIAANVLSMNISEFILLRHGGRTPPVVAASVEESLESAVEKMIFAKVHRIWVQRRGSHEISVVSLTDVIRGALGVMSRRHK